MQCPIHKLPMTQLLTSWVCDVCHPTQQQQPVDEFIKVDKKLFDSFYQDLDYMQNNIASAFGVPASLLNGGSPAGTPTSVHSFPKNHICGNGYRWHLWPRDPTELHVPKSTNTGLYYLSSNQVLSVSDTVLLQYSTVVVMISDNTISPGTTVSTYNYAKHRYSTEPISRGLSMNQWSSVTKMLDNVRLNMGKPGEYMVYFLDVSFP